MKRVVGDDLKGLEKNVAFYSYIFRPSSFSEGVESRIIGRIYGENLFLCPYLSIDRERGICDRCKYEFNNK